MYNIIFRYSYYINFLISSSYFVPRPAGSDRNAVEISPGAMQGCTAPKHEHPVTTLPAKIDPSKSALLNTAEGNGKQQRPGRAKSFDDARGSATECAACLDALAAKGACTVGRIVDKKNLTKSGKPLRVSRLFPSLEARVTVRFPELPLG
jgi:hypothetical protein